MTNIVQLIQRRFETDVCSVYLLEPDRANLVLTATIGLRPDTIGRVRMRLTEGLAGLVAEQLRPQSVADATLHPRFKYFREAGEDPYLMLTFLFTSNRVIPDMAARAPDRGAAWRETILVLLYAGLGQVGGWIVAPALGYRAFSFHVAGTSSDTQ